MAALVICVGWAVGFESGVRFTDARRAASTILGVKILGHFLNWWAAQWCLVQESALLVVPGRQKKWNWCGAPWHLSQWNCSFMAFVCQGCMLLFTTPRAILLSVCMGVGGCLWPISAIVFGVVGWLRMR